MSDIDDPSERDAVDERRDEVEPEPAEGATPGTVGALDGTAAAGSAGAVSSGSGADEDEDRGAAAPDPTVGPD